MSLPYLDGPRLENLELASGKTVKFYWLVPITPAEVSYKKKHGLEELELQFERANFHYSDPGRVSVV